MPLLYNSQISGNCWKVRQILAHLEIPYERQEMDVVDRTDRPEKIGHLNPAMRVPTIVLDDGRPLGESNAIITYFAEGTPYLPSDRYERAQVFQWLFFEQYSHEPYFAVARFLKRFAATPPTEEQLAAIHEQGYKTLTAMERHLSSRAFLVGDAYSIADIALYAYTHVAEEGDFDLSRAPAVRDWIDRVASQPGHVALDA